MEALRNKNAASIAGDNPSIITSTSTETALRESNEKFHQLADNITDVFWIRSPDMREVHYVSPAFEKIWGVPVGTQFDNPQQWTDFIVTEDRERVQSEFLALTRDAATIDVEYRICRPDGQVRWIRSRGFQVRDADNKLIRLTGIVTDIHALKLAQLEILRTNRALKMLSSCSAARVRAETELQLLSEVCRIAIEDGGYRMAWVGYAQDDDVKSIIPVAHAGLEKGFLSNIKVSWHEDDPEGQGPAGQVIRTGCAVVHEDLAQEPKASHWVPAVHRLAYRGTVCLPLRDATRTFGLLVLYNAELKQTSDEELTLLREMADDVALGVVSLRTQADARRLQAAVDKIAAAVSAVTGAEFFEQLASKMAEALEATGGFVTQLLVGDPLMGRTIAAVVDGKVMENFSYAVKGTPCENLLTSDTWVVAKQVVEEYPDAPMLAFLGAQGYVGRRLDNSSGQALGHLFVVFREPIKEVGFISSTLQIFASRAAGELERRQADAQIREQAALLDVTHEAIQVKDLDGSILLWNKGAERTYGWMSDEVVGRKAAGWLYKDPTEFQIAQAEVLEKGEWEGEIIKRTRDGRDLTVASRWTLVRDAAGNPKAILSIDADITGKKALETQLMVSDRMASVGTLAAGVAHEINNPLAAVMGNLDYIADSLGRMSSDEMASMTPGMRDAWIRDEIKTPLDEAVEAAQRVRFIVRDLKIFSHSPNDAARGPLNVETIMESSLRMAWNEIRHRANLVKRYGRVPEVEGNEARLGQVFLNLVVNAAQSLPTGQAEQNEIGVTTRVEGEHVIIEVSDTGAGIPPQIIGRIFDAFFTTKAVGVGTGLGLAICQRIVTDMGGTLTVESELGKGTTFRVSVPIARKKERDIVAPTAQLAVTARRGRILVVDDEELVLRSVRRILSQEHDVLAMISATDALALCAGGEKFDLILCDLMMPDMTGMDLHRELMLVAPEQADRMIFITGGAFTEKARAFLSETPKEHIDKPFYSANLRALVQRYLR
jgi:PAS domain S-box-containing protein